MNLGYRKTRIINTSQLPGVLADPPMDIEFINFISVGESQIIGRIANDFNSDDPDIELILQLGKKAIVAVFGSDGTRHELGKDCTLQDVIDATEQRLIIAIVTGWVLLMASEIASGKKKYQTLNQPLSFTKSRKMS